MKRVSRIAVACAALCCVALPAFGQQPTLEEQMRQLQSRMEALEQENTAMRQALATPAAGPQLSTTAPLMGPPPLDDSLPAPDVAPPEICDDDSYVIGSDLNMSAYWKDGFEVATKHKDFRTHIGGRAQVDAGWFDADESVQENINHPYEDGADFRRARLRVDGTMYGFIEYATEYDFVNGFQFDGIDRTMIGLTDCWVIFNDLPMGNLRIGQQKPAIGFEHLVSSRFLPFMERSYNQDSFYGGTYNGFLPGVSLFDTYGNDDDGTWNVGIFKPTDNVFAAAAHDGDYMAVVRGTKLLYYYDEGAQLFHVGASAVQQSTVGGRVVYRTRDAIRTGLAPSWPVPASTGVIGGDDIQWINGELAAVNGPFTFQAEYLANYMTDAAPIVGNVVQTAQGDVLYHGGYAQMLYFITGEHDNYDKMLGVFARVRPNENFFSSSDECGRHCGGGRGAWQVGARYDYLDLNDNNFNGGILHNGTLGLNWFLNPNMKFQFNYIVTHRDAPLAGDLGDGWINGFGTRFAMDF